MVYHHLNGHEFDQAPGVGDRQGSLACFSPWGRKESDTTMQLNGTVSFSVVPFSSCPQSLPATESFPMSQLSHEVANLPILAI